MQKSKRTRFRVMLWFQSSYFAIKQRRINITGLGFTESMLAKARKKFERESISCDLILGDMRDFSIDVSFDLIFIPFHSIQNTYTANDIDAILKCVRNHLSDDGVFALDIFNPNLAYLTRAEDDLEEIINFRAKSGCEL